MSSGTTNPNPVKVYRSPLDLAIMIRGNTFLFEYVYGKEVESEKGIALFMAARSSDTGLTSLLSCILL